MKLWIKICGLTTEEAVEAALAADVSAIGFVFAESKRRVTPQHASTISRRANSSVARVAVMLHPSQSELDEVCSVFKPDVLQTDIEDLTSLRVPANLQVLPVVRRAETIASNTPPRLLFEGPVSGVGAKPDWETASQLARRTQLVLAGGLNPENVNDAIATVRPFGVDVSSGVERGPGDKDPQKILQFVNAARTAANRLGT